ncbi:MAG: RtcB family protein [Thermoanaerobaculia bacterium]|nr:RtcB family protein [Thermoanaerobaculia bacterium]
MRVPARFYASESMLDDIHGDRSLDQLVNVATLPGIRRYAIAMPDAHEGYGFPIGGVAAFDLDEGVISPGGIGYDINCGVRMLRSTLTRHDVSAHLEALVQQLSREVPSGVGRGGVLRLDEANLDRVLAFGSKRMVELGYGTEADLDRTESRGTLTDADPALVSRQAKQRGADQLGTMGAGNHFVEVDLVERVFDAEAAAMHGITEGQVVMLIHTGSRGLGHQVATDYLKTMTRAMTKHAIRIPDRELACVPFRSAEGRDYFGAMSAGANFAWANRQLITSEVRRAWHAVFGASGGTLELVYDVAHNIAKIEEHLIGGHSRRVVVHRKGATRAFEGQPVLIPGSMGTASYLLTGRREAMNTSFGSACHGAGRRMSRSKAKREVDAGELRERLRRGGISVRAGSNAGLVEEAPEAYKDVDAVVEVVHRAGIATKVARLRPIAVVKG